jgi:hypothetical protein
MAYEITLHDSTTSWTSPSPNTPLTEQIIEASSEVTTLDLNVYIDLLNTKRSWTINWGYMSATDYETLRGFYNRQFTALEFPDVTIPDLGVSSVVVRATLSDKNITDKSGLVENVQLTLRETIQATTGYFIS